MKRRIIAAALALAVAGSLSSAAIAFADDHATSPQPGKSAHAGKTDGDDANEPAGGGPPPWAHGGRADQGWKAAWHALTPAERKAKMSGLAKEHAAGMKTWAACARAAGADSAARAKCVRPLPPGLAKKQLAN